MTAKFTYEKGLVAGDIAFKMGGKKLYTKDGDSFKRLNITLSGYTIDVLPEDEDYARGYVQGYESSKEQFAKRI